MVLLYSEASYGSSEILNFLREEFLSSLSKISVGLPLIVPVCLQSCQLNSWSRSAGSQDVSRHPRLHASETSISNLLDTEINLFFLKYDFESVGSELVLSYSKKSCISWYYTKFSTNNKTGFNLIIFHFKIPRKAVFNTMR